MYFACISRELLCLERGVTVVVVVVGAKMACSQVVKQHPAQKARANLSRLFDNDHGCRRFRRDAMLDDDGMLVYYTSNWMGGAVASFFLALSLSPSFSLKQLRDK